MTALQTASVTVTMNNTGTTTWTAGTYFLGSQNPQGNTTWGPSQVGLPASVASGSQVTFTFNITVPATPGTYNFQWQMKNGSGYFGGLTTNVAIQVSASPIDNAAFVSQSVPTTMTVLQTASVTVTMNNTGTTTWTAGTYFLGSQNPQGNTTWGPSQVGLASSVAPGGSVTLTFNITAPSVAGTYNFQWQMKQGSSNFGALSPNVAVIVSTTPPSNNAGFVS
jgi:uncharacterized membrane protein